MTAEKVLQDPSLAHFHEAIHFMEKNKDKIFFPEKFMLNLKHWVTQDLKILYRKSPNMPLLDVVITTLTGMNEKMTPEMITEITNFAMTKWESLQQTVREKAPVKMYAPIPELYAVANEDGVNNDVAAAR